MNVIVVDQKIRGVLADEIETTDIFEKIEQLLRSALQYADNKYDLEDIKTGLVSRALQLWIAEKDGKITTCAVTQITKYPRETRATIMFCAGSELNKLISFQDIFYQWARENGCKSIELYGRPGWEGVLKKQGYEKIQTLLRRQL